MKAVKRVFILAFILIAASQTAFATEPEIDAGAAILVEQATGEVLFEKNPDVQMFPASLTKIMTALLTIEHGGLDAVVTVSQSSETGLDPDGSSVLPQLKTGEQLTIKDLLYCMMVSSDNRACNVVAEYVSGSVPAFVELMNKRAAELGCKNTVFENPNGLHNKNHYTTARDLYLISNEAVKNQVFMEIVNVETKKIAATNLSEERHLVTTNYLISKRKSPNYIYSYARGIKTGHTTPAGYCFVSSAEKNDFSLVSVVLGASRDAKTQRIGSFDSTIKLFKWGFDNFARKTLVKKGENIIDVPVELAQDNDHVVLQTDSSISAVVPVDFDVETLERDIKLFSEGALEAPIEKGQKLGEVVYTKDGKEYGKLALVASNSLSRSQMLYIIKVIKDFVTQPWFIWLVVILVLLLAGYIALMMILNSRRRRESGRASYKGRRNRR